MEKNQDRDWLTPEQSPCDPHGLSCRSRCKRPARIAGLCPPCRAPPPLRAGRDARTAGLRYRGIRGQGPLGRRAGAGRDLGGDVPRLAALCRTGSRRAGSHRTGRGIHRGCAEPVKSAGIPIQVRSRVYLKNHLKKNDISIHSPVHMVPVKTMNLRLLFIPVLLALLLLISPGSASVVLSTVSFVPDAPLTPGDNSTLSQRTR